jgi:hypothetical protein
VRDKGIEMRMRFHGVPVVINERAPLRKTTRIDAEDYDVVEIESDALCMIMDGVVYLHRDRWKHFEVLKGRLP